MLPLYHSQYHLPHTHLRECDPMSSCDVTKDQNAAVVLLAVLCTALPCTVNTGSDTCKSAIQHCNTPLTGICVWGCLAHDVSHTYARACSFALK